MLEVYGLFFLGASAGKWRHGGLIDVYWYRDRIKKTDVLDMRYSPSFLGSVISCTVLEYRYR